MPRPPRGATLGYSGSSAFVDHETDIAGSYIFVATSIEDAGYRKNPFDRSEDEPAVQRVSIVKGVAAIPQDDEATIFLATAVADWITLSFDPRAKLVSWAEIALDVKLGKDDEFDPSVIVGRPVWMEIRSWEKREGGFGAGFTQPQTLQPGVTVPDILAEFIRSPEAMPPPFVWLPADEVERRRERALGTKSNGEQQPDDRPRSDVQDPPAATTVVERNRANSERTAAAVTEQPGATASHTAAVQALSSVLQAILEEEFGYHTDATTEDKLASLAAFWVYFNNVPTIRGGKSERGGFRIDPGTFTEEGAHAAVLELEKWDRGRGDDIRAQPFAGPAEPEATEPPMPELPE